MLTNRRPIRLCCIFCALLTGIAAWLLMLARDAGTLFAQEPATVERSALAEPPSRYETRKEHDPNGIGKFYRGREIARVMSFHGAPWLERPEREEEERLSQLIGELKLSPGEVVADIGAGSGVLSLMMAQQVTNSGKVFAVDIQQEMLDLIASKVSKRDISNVEVVLGTEKSPKLKENSIDMALMVDVYHELEYPYEMLREISRMLKPGGRIVLVEYRREDPAVPIKLVHKMTEAQVKKELADPEFDWTWKETIATLPRQHIIVFQKAGGKSVSGEEKK